MLNFGSWLSFVPLSDAVALAGFIIALVGLGMNTVQVRLLVRQLRLDAVLRIAESSRGFTVVSIERPELWDSLQHLGPTAGPENLRRNRFIQLWLNHAVVVWKCWRAGMLEVGDWEACRRDMESILAFPAVREEWLRVRDFYPRGFQQELSDVVGGTPTVANGS